MKKRMRYVVETRLTGSFKYLRDAKVWAAEQRENGMQVSDPLKLGDGWLCVAMEFGDDRKRQAMTDETRHSPAETVSHAWRCFHCNELFSDRLAAAEHFGISDIETPACKLNSMEGGLLGLVRRQAEQIDAYHREDTASYREFYSLGADHSQALRREEEKGYARGLRDARVDMTAKPKPGQELMALREAIITHTRDERLFWIGEILLAELEKETGFNGIAVIPDTKCRHCIPIEPLSDTSLPEAK